MRKIQWLKIILAVLVIWYGLLVIIHYANQRPLWLDEYLVFLNLKELSTRDILTQSLNHVQAFPKCHLIAIQWLSQWAHDSLLSLRIVAFLSMVLAFGLWLRLALRYFTDDLSKINFCAMWCASIPLIYYAAELKPYSFDVLAVVVALSALLQMEHPRRQWLLCGLAILGLFSYVAILSLPVCCVWCLFYRKRSSIPWGYILGYAGLSLMIIGAVFWFDIRNGNGMALKQYWQEYFISAKTIPLFFQTFGESINNFLSRWFVETPRVFRALSRVFMFPALFFMLVRGYIAFRDQGLGKDAVAFFGCVFFVFLLILSAAGQYAFSVPRMSLFFAPFLFWSCATFLQWLKTQNPMVFWPLQMTFWVYLGIMTIGIARCVFAGDLGAQSVIWQ